jgi:predicted glycogen debranching enzyme
VELPKITLQSKALERFNEAINTEWLVTNGIGGYAASTALSLNTRKYHGLLVASLNPPRKRTVCLAKLDEDIIKGDIIYRLGANEFYNTIFPQGYKFLKSFSISPFPTFTYEVNDLIVNKTICMPFKKNAVVLLYNFLNRSNSQLKARFFPLASNRHFHSVVNHLKEQVMFQQHQNGLKVKLTFDNPQNTIVVNATEGKFVDGGNWVERLHYRQETMRGEADTDDCYQPGYYELTLEPKREKKFGFAASANPSNDEAEEALNALGLSLKDFEQVLATELECRSVFLHKFYNSHATVPVADWLSWIILSTNAFLVKDLENQESIIAGYFWFESWGRDTFISLPGLLLVTGRFEAAKRILLQFGSYIKNGLIPNLLLDESGEPLYNTVDGTLWYINAVFQYLKYTGDFDFVQQALWTKLKAIIEKHERGTPNDIRVDTDGLISHGSQLTWMDAAIEGKAVTPRSGKAVEIQALWYNALKINQLLADKFKERNIAEKYDAMTEKAKMSFEAKFWNKEKQCLFDVVEESSVDRSLRPNQIIAAALDFRMLGNDKNKQIVEFVQREFLTPFGLRTLSRSDPRYRGNYEGDARMRDQTYHNGTIWPWLTGPFTTAFLKANGYSVKNRQYAYKTFIQALFEKHIYNAGLGTISEIFDGDAPNKPRGCVAQAWSVAEPFRAYIEDIMQKKPAYEKEVFQV